MNDFLIRSATSWQLAAFSEFNKAATDFAKNGLGGNVGPAVGWLIVVFGIIAAVFLFMVHKTNPQSRLPKPWGILAGAIFGGMLASGQMPRLIKTVTDLGETVLKMFGV